MLIIGTSKPPAELGLRRFLVLGNATIAIVYALILVGSIVRASGSGMGCPDWPKCFGQWIPPTNLSQLPTGYEATYAIPGHIPVFNVTKTWTEYLNRLLGVLTGFFIFGTLITSTFFWNKNRTIVWVTLAAFLLVGFQGWLGAKVVSSVLAPWMVTVHMFVALLIVSLLLFAVGWPIIAPVTLEAKTKRNLLLAFALLFALSLVQIGLGVWVRQNVDVAANVLGEENRSHWLDNNAAFPIHRSFMWLLIGLNIFIYSYLRKIGSINKNLFTAYRLSVFLLVANGILGIIFDKFGFPAFAQPLHLLCGSLLLGAYFIVLLILVKPRTSIESEFVQTVSSTSQNPS